MAVRKRYVLTGGGLILFLVSLVTAVRFAGGTIGALNSPNFKVKGAKDAPVHLVVYSDFQCPACQTAVQPVEELRNEFSEAMEIEFRHFPLERSHRWAMIAARFAECAAAQGKFWEFHDRLFLEQTTWAQSENAISIFAGYVQELQLDRKKITECLESSKTIARVRREHSIGSKQGVQSTPTIFINSHMLVGSLQLKTNGRNIVLEELKRLGASEQVHGST